MSSRTAGVAVAVSASTVGLGGNDDSGNAIASTTLAFFVGAAVVAVAFLLTLTMPETLRRASGAATAETDAVAGGGTGQTATS